MESSKCTYEVTYWPTEETQKEVFDTEEKALEFARYLEYNHRLFSEVTKVHPDGSITIIST